MRWYFILLLKFNIFFVFIGCRYLGVIYIVGDIFFMGDDCNVCKCLRMGEVECLEKRCYLGNYDFIIKILILIVMYFRYVVYNFKKNIVCIIFLS